MASGDATTKSAPPCDALVHEAISRRVSMHAEVPDKIPSLCPVTSNSGKNSEQYAGAHNGIFAIPEIALICKQVLYYPNHTRFLTNEFKVRVKLGGEN
jgi:hypothetical protein